MDCAQARVGSMRSTQTGKNSRIAFARIKRPPYITQLASMTSAFARIVVGFRLFVRSVKPGDHKSPTGKHRGAPIDAFARTHRIQVRTQTDIYLQEI
jgi:hypothetical protein